MKSTSIVVSGFEPFGEAPENPTLAVLERLAGWTDCPGDLHCVPLPVDSSRIAGLVGHILDERQPDVWIGLGLAMGSAVIAVERIGVNVLDFAIPDNAGARFAGAPIVAAGPAAYLASLPVAGIVMDLRAAGIPARISNSASTYLCNQLLYTLLHQIENRRLKTRAGFLHMPAHPALAARHTGTHDMASMSLDLMAEAVRGAIATTWRTINVSHGRPEA